MATYLQDTFSGSSGTLLSATTADSGATWPTDSVHLTGPNAITLDGAGMVYSSSSSPNAMFSTATLPTGSFQINFTLLDKNPGNGGWAAVSIYDASPISTFANSLSLMYGSGPSYGGMTWQTNGLGPSNASGYDGILYGIPANTPYYFKVIVLNQNGSGTAAFYYSTSPTGPWLQQSSYPSTSFSSPLAFNVGPLFNGYAASATTGVHIGDLIVQDIVFASPTSTLSKAYVSSSGESLVLFFENSASTPTAGNFMVSVPTVYRNGTSMGVSSSAVSYINPSALCTILPLPTPVLSTDTLTLSAGASWLMLNDLSTVQAVSGYAVTNYVGRSCFGTDTLARTLKMGLNVPMVGSAAAQPGQMFKNMVTRMNCGRSLPTALGGVQTFQFLGGEKPASQTPSSFNEPSLSATNVGYFAIGYDDEYVANSGSATGQLTIVSQDSNTTVTQIHSCDNTGGTGASAGLGQYYLFEVTNSGLTSAGGGVAPVFSVDLGLSYPSGSGNTYVTNLWILGPGEFTYSLGTPLEFSRATPWVISNAYLTHLPSGIGSMRVLEGLLGPGSDGAVQVCEPWESRQVTDVSWNVPVVDNQISFSQVRPFLTSTSPWVYADQYGSPWTALSSPLSTAIPSGTSLQQTTITMTSAATECSPDSGSGNGPIFYGIMIAIGGQGGSGTLEYMRCLGSSGTTVTVVRGCAFNGVSTPAVAHSTGEIITLGNRWAWTSISNLTNILSNYGHQIAEFVCTAPHNLESGVQPVTYSGPSGYPVNDTNGNAFLTNGIGNMLVTGMHTLVAGPWNGYVNSTYASAPAATLASTYTIPSPTVDIYQTLPGDVFPYEAACHAMNAFNCVGHVSFPLLASDTFIYAKAQIYLNTLTPGRTIYVELANEPFGSSVWIENTNSYLEQIISPGSVPASGPWNGLNWYLYRHNQVFTMFKSVFTAAGRGSEVLSLANAGPWYDRTLQVAQANSWRIDGLGVAPYYDAGNDSSAAAAAFCNANTLNQIADLHIHQVMYYPGVMSFSGGVPGSEFSGIQSLIDAYNTATGFNAKLFGYEGGYSRGCSTNSVGPTSPYGTNGFYNFRATADVRYLPIWRIYEKDFYAAVQTGGYVALNTYGESLYYSYQNCWNVYTWMNQIPGKGDGSDGKFDNRTCMQTLQLTGPTYFTAGYVGAGSGTLSIANGADTATFSTSQSFTPGMTWIMIEGDTLNQQYYLIAGSGVGPWTLWNGTSSPNYGGPTNTTAAWIYGNATSQDQQCVSVRGQALLEWNATSGSPSLSSGSAAILIGF